MYTLLIYHSYNRNVWQIIAHINSLITVINTINLKGFCPKKAIHMLSFPRKLNNIDTFGVLEQQKIALK